MLVLAVVLECKAHAPTATFLQPVVLSPKAPAPKAVLSEPVNSPVLPETELCKADLPIAVLLVALGPEYLRAAAPTAVFSPPVSAVESLPNPQLAPTKVLVLAVVAFFPARYPIKVDAIPVERLLPAP